MRDKVSSFLDTNILVYATFNDLPQYSIAKELRDKAASKELEAYLSPQILAEFYSVVTNSERIVKPLSPGKAREEIDVYLSTFPMLKVKDTTTRKMVKLAQKHKVTGQNIYDAQIVATMLVNRVKRIYTANDKDFRKFKIEVINPFKRK
ncbi:PIN domain-containing protein [candidate division NPL-UPA2 bacterium]|nr:PIN domain-containing protein [candidate division NPL-UPA2 bacterium]